MNSRRFRQTGAVLIMALVMLVVLTLIGLSAMQVSTMEEVMAGNLKDCNQGFQAAEAAISDAADWLSTRRTKPVATPTAANNVYSSSVYTLGETDTPATLGFDWGSNAIRYGALNAGDDTIAKVIGTCSPGTPAAAGNAMSDLYSLPCLVIEEHAFVPDNLDPDTTAKGVGDYYYRITTRGFGGTEKVQPRLQAMLYARYN